MFSIAFYPEYDGCHAAFRALCIKSKFPRLMIDQYRIVDYYFLNPFDISSLRMPGNSHRKIAESYSDLRPYKRATEPATVAIYMWQFQQAALVTLARQSFINSAALANDAVWFEDKLPTSEELNKEVLIAVDSKRDVLDFLATAIEKFPINGPGGLKDRSGLLDFRYDVKDNVNAA